MADWFDWDADNIAHIAEHDVTPDEAEQVIENNPLYLDYEIRSGEIRHREVGETAAGRILQVVSTVRNDQVRVIAAYPPSRLLRTTYLRYQEWEQHGKAHSS